MNSTLAFLRTRRFWVIESISVWGSISAYAGSLIVAENTGSEKRLLFWKVDIGGDIQQIRFADLVDINGNQLPETITRPKVIVLPRNETGVVIVGRESETAFSIAKTSPASSSGLVDLLIVEAGL